MFFFGGQVFLRQQWPIKRGSTCTRWRNISFQWDDGEVRARSQFMRKRRKCGPCPWMKDDCPGKRRKGWWGCCQRAYYEKLSVYFLSNMRNSLHLGFNFFSFVFSRSTHQDNKLGRRELSGQWILTISGMQGMLGLAWHGWIVNGVMLKIIFPKVIRYILYHTSFG